MAFPTIAGAVDSHHWSTTLSHSIALPSPISAGELLIAGFVAGAGDAVATWPAGWTQLFSEVNTSGFGHRLQARYRIADGSEGSTITVTTDEPRVSAHACYRITGWHGSAAPEVAAVASGGSGNADPPSLTPSSGADDLLWIAVGSAQTGSNVFTGFPASYGVNAFASNGNDVQMGIAARQLNSATEDPGTFTNPSAPWIAQTIAVRPPGGLSETTVEEYLRAEAALQIPTTTGERYLRGAALLSYPEDYLKIGATLKDLPILYAKFQAALRAEGGSYLKLGPLLEKRVEPYVKFEVAFPSPPQSYLRTAAAFAAQQNSYIRAVAQFASHGAYLKARATLVRTPILSEVPNEGGEGQVGLLSRQYLSLVSVKKEIS